MSATFNFTKRTFAAIKKIDSDLFDELVAPHGSPESYMYLHRTSHKTLFERSGVLDNPGRSPLVRSLVYDIGEDNQFKDWILEGGSPMLSTQLKRKDVETVPILGYRQSVFDAYPSDFPPYKFPADMPLEQWQLGTTPAMIASSLLRVMGKGRITGPMIEKIGIPKGLFEVFKDPEVEVPLTEFLANQPKIHADGSFMDHSAHFGSVAFILMKYGTDEQLKALAGSDAGSVLTERADEVFSQLIFCECHKAEPDIQGLFARASEVFGLNSLSEEFDLGLTQMFGYSNETGRDALIAYSVSRMAALAEAGRLHQAVRWLHHVVEETPAIPELDTQARKKFVRAYSAQPQSDKKLMSQLNGNHRLRFAIRVLGPEAFVKEYGKELFASYKASWDNVSTDMGMGGVIGDGLLPDPAALKEFGLIIPVLEKLDEFWGKSWADDAKHLANCQELNLAKRMLKRHLERVAGWVGEALTADPDQVLAHKWYDRLEHPFVQLSFVDAMPFDKSLRQRMAPNTQGQQFLRDLGM
jgi:hypothetical protein